MPASLPGTGVPSPAPSNASNFDMKKRKRHDFLSQIPKKTAVEIQQEQTYQPTETLSQISIAIDYLKDPKTMEEKPDGVAFDDLLRYLSLHRNSEEAISKLRRAMTAGRHPKIEYNTKTAKLKYRPVLPIRNAEDLKRFLQQRKSMIGVKIDDVKDGWPDCIPELESMAGRGEILLARSGPSKPSNAAVPNSAPRKDPQPRTIWPSDKTLVPNVTADLRRQWEAIPIPALDDTLRDRLQQAGLKASMMPGLNNAAVPAAKKRKQRKNARGTTTNVNVPMRDYSHLRK